MYLQYWQHEIFFSQHGQTFGLLQFRHMVAEIARNPWFCCWNNKNVLIVIKFIFIIEKKNVKPYVPLQICSHYMLPDAIKSWWKVFCIDLQMLFMIYSQTKFIECVDIVLFDTFEEKIFNIMKWKDSFGVTSIWQKPQLILTEILQLVEMMCSRDKISVSGDAIATLESCSTFQLLWHGWHEIIICHQSVCKFKQSLSSNSPINQAIRNCITFLLWDT